MRHRTTVDWDIDLALRAWEHLALGALSEEEDFIVTYRRPLGRHA